MPRSRSRSIASRTCASISRACSAPVISRKRSASVDLPWSMCAMTEKLRIFRGSNLTIIAAVSGLTDYHAKYIAHELTLRARSDSVEKLATALADAQVDLNPHQVDASLFAF